MSNLYAVKTITNLLREKKEILERLLELTARQVDYIQKEDLEDLLNNIEEKQRVLAELEEMQGQLRGLTRVSPEDARLAIEINKLVEEITRVDRGNQQMVRQRMSDVRGHLAKVAQGRRGHNGYHVSGGPRSTFDLNR